MSGAPFVKNRTTFEITFLRETGSVRDISTATTIEIRFKKPDGTAIAKNMTLVTDGTDGKARYKSEDSFLDQAGVWKYLGRVIIDGDEFIGGDDKGSPLEAVVEGSF